MAQLEDLDTSFHTTGPNFCSALNRGILVQIYLDESQDKHQDECQADRQDKRQDNSQDESQDKRQDESQDKLQDESQDDHQANRHDDRQNRRLTVGLGHALQLVLLLDGVAVGGALG